MTRTRGPRGQASPRQGAMLALEVSPVPVAERLSSRGLKMSQRAKSGRPSMEVGRLATSSQKSDQQKGMLSLHLGAKK